MSTLINGGSSRNASRKSIWSQIIERAQSWVSDVESFMRPKEGVDSVAFSISFIALSAKLAKADGQVTRDEVTMFRRLFDIPPSEEQKASRVYNLCRQDTTGFESYAKKMHRTLGHSEGADAIRRDVLDGLFHIAMADGEFHPGEEAFLSEVSRIFEIDEAVYMSLMAQHVPDRADPFAVLGLHSDAGLDELKAARHRIIKESHPDLMLARGIPDEMIALATTRLKSVNEAYKDAKLICIRRSEDNTLTM